MLFIPWLGAAWAIRPYDVQQTCLWAAVVIRERLGTRNALRHARTGRISLAVHLIFRSVQRTTSNAYSGLGVTSCLCMAIQPASCWRSRPTSTTSTRGILEALDIVPDEETLSSSSCGDESGRTKSNLQRAPAQARRDGAMGAARPAIRRLFACLSALRWRGTHEYS